VKILPPATALGALAALALVSASPVIAQRQQVTPEQRIDRLERQVQQMQRQVFPKGRPADTAGFSDEPAATQSSVVTLDQRLDALERQMADILRQSEENGHALQTLQAELAKVRSDEEQRIGALEQRMNETAAAAAAAAATPAVETPAPATKPSTIKPSTTKPTTTKPKGDAKTTAAAPEGGPDTVEAAATDPGEDAYSEGFHLWENGQYDEAISKLRAFTAAYPKHRRVSYANNLIGRALLDKGDARAAANALLANYRNNPAGERAADSLYYLGQALMALGQPGQACKAYQELDAVYGSKVRADLKSLVQAAETKAQCS
jgi:TolA-binding protein